MEGIPVIFRSDDGPGTSTPPEIPGATGLLARWFHSPPDSRPPELTVEHYTDKNFIITNDAVTKHAAENPHANPPIETAATIFDRLWSLIDSARDPQAMP